MVDLNIIWKNEFNSEKNKKPSQWRTATRRSHEKSGDLQKVMVDKSLKLCTTSDLVIQDYIDWGRGFEKRLYCLEQEAVIKTIEQLLGVDLIREYKVNLPSGDYYRLDAYDPLNNVVYEVDESHHSYQEGDDNIREEYLVKFLGCNFVRIKI